MIHERLSIKAHEPEAYKAMAALQAYGNQTQVSALHREMIKIRASQVNGCAYCIQSHTADARKLGESEQRIYALSAWWESPLFSEEERAILALTDEVSLIADDGVTDETYKAAVTFFGEKVTAQLIMLIITINAWNRIAISTHMVHK